MPKQQPFALHSPLKKTLRLLILLLALPSLSTVLHAVVPQMINFQGRIAVGDPAINFDGPGLFKFALVNETGTASYWSSDGTSVGGSEPSTAVTIPVRKGLYSVLLGNTASPFEMNAISPEVFAQPDVRLRIWFSDGVNGFQMLSPDQRIVPVGYAMVAAGLTADATIPGLESALKFDAPNSLNREQRRHLAATWPEATGTKIAPIGAIADGTSHPCSERFDTLSQAQEVWPHVESLADEQDWAAIQAALNSLNLDEGKEYGGTVFLPAGNYVINRTLYLRGPGVTLVGENRYSCYVEYTGSSGYALRLSPARGLSVADAGTNGLPQHCKIANIKFNNAEDFIGSYLDASGANQRTSFLNDRLMRVVGQRITDANSGTAEMPIESIPLNPKSLAANGDKMVIQASGSFAANTNEKGFKFLVRWQRGDNVFDEDNFFAAFASELHNAQDWTIEITAQRRSRTVLVTTTKFFVSGRNPEVRVESLNVDLAAATVWDFIPIGDANGDVVLKSFDMAYVKGTSNR